MRRRAQHVTQRIIGRGSYGLWGLLIAPMMVLLIVGSAQLAPTVRADSATGSMHVVVPAPSTDNTTVQGTVGTNVSIASNQATANATYNLGWARRSTGCAGGFTPLTNGMTTVTADDGGNFTATFVWPDAAGHVGAYYLICAGDTANPLDMITADQAIQVLGSSPPTVALSQAPSSTHSGEAYDAGGPVEVQGRGFLPQGTQIAIFVTTRETFDPQDFQSGNALKTEDGSPITSDGQGQFTAIVTLPTIVTGQLFLHAVSTDAVSSGQASFPPSLVATQTIHINQPPQPTPTVQPSPTATPATSGTGTKDTKGQNNGLRIAAIALLGVLSLILFIIGGILIASATIGPRNPPAHDSGARAQADTARPGP
ncbi:MAG TPA: hypothetical protein VFU63_00495, partial [Ktedonobacterales bacterium]|nr:hypothetical protein [Ktedonobacterales bacterium]